MRRRGTRRQTLSSLRVTAETRRRYERALQALQAHFGAEQEGTSVLSGDPEDADALVAEYLSSIIALDFTAEDRPLVAMPLYHSAALHVFLMPYLCLGASIRLIAKLPTIAAMALWSHLSDVGRRTRVRTLIAGPGFVNTCSPNSTNGCTASFPKSLRNGVFPS